MMMDQGFTDVAAFAQYMDSQMRKEIEKEYADFVATQAVKKAPDLSANGTEALQYLAASGSGSGISVAPNGGWAILFNGGPVSTTPILNHGGPVSLQRVSQNGSQMTTTNLPVSTIASASSTRKYHWAVGIPAGLALGALGFVAGQEIFQDEAGVSGHYSGIKSAGVGTAGLALGLSLGFINW